MNVRKNIDYSRMYEAIDEIMTQNLPQMQMYASIGKIVCTRSEKGAAVMASEYIIANYPGAKGFSPRSLRRMRDFYHTYENHPALLFHAMQLGWIQNVVIMEAELTMDLREWYINASMQLGWSKTELVANISSNAHEKMVLDTEKYVKYGVEQSYRETEIEIDIDGNIRNRTQLFVFRMRRWWSILKEIGLQDSQFGCRIFIN